MTALQQHFPWLFEGGYNRKYRFIDDQVGWVLETDHAATKPACHAKPHARARAASPPAQSETILDYVI